MTVPLNVLWYSLEKIGNAAEELAVADAPLRERLCLAWREFYFLGPDDMPSQRTRALVVAFRARTHWAGDMATTLALVSDDEVRELARMLFELHLRLQEALPAAQAAHAREVQARGVVRLDSRRAGKR